MSIRLTDAIARIESSDGTICGTGFFVQPARRLVTCAHVVDAALGRPQAEETWPAEPVRVVHLATQSLFLARVVAWSPLDEQDVALLAVEGELPPEVGAVPLFATTGLRGQSFRAFGFPAGYDEGRFGGGQFTDPLPLGGFQVASTDVEPGFSGGPVQDLHMGRVLGLVAAVDRDGQPRAFFQDAETIERVARVAGDDGPVPLTVIRATDRFSPLTDGLIGAPEAPHAGLEQYLEQYLGSPDRPVPFGGRQEALAQLDAWLAGDSAYALIAEPAGRGKSALVSQWVKQVVAEGRADVAFVPISQRHQLARKSKVFSLLHARLRALCSPDAEPLTGQPPDLGLGEIQRYLHECPGQVERPWLIVLDGADEGAGWRPGEDLQFPLEPRSGVRVLVTARLLAGDEGPSGWLERLGWRGRATVIPLARLDEAGVADVLKSMGDPLETLAEKERVVGELVRLSAGDPLLVRLYVDELLAKGPGAGGLTAEDLAGLKPGYAAYFERWLDDQDRAWKETGEDPLRGREDVMTFLKLLAAAAGPLSCQEVARLAGAPLDQLSRQKQVVRLVERLVLGDGTAQPYTYSHPKLRDYVFDAEMLEDEQAVWRRKFLIYGRQVLDDLNNAALPPAEAKKHAHILQHYSLYLADAIARGEAAPQDIYALLTDGWMRAWYAFEGGAYDGFLADVARVRDVAERVSDAEALGTLIRCVLCFTSVNSLSGNIPPKLLALAVASGDMSPEVALTYTRRAGDSERRGSGLRELIPVLAEKYPALLPEVRRSASSQLEAKEYILVLVTLAEHVLDEAARFGRGSSPASVSPAVARSAASPVSRLISEALECAESLSDERSRAQVLVALAPHDPSGVRKAARGIRSERERARVLAALARYDPSWVHEAALGIQDQGERARVLAALAAEDAAAIPEALKAARGIRNERERARVLAALARYDPSGVHEAALGLQYEGYRAEVLAAVAAEDAAAIPEALEAARGIRDERERAGVLAALARYDPSGVHEAALGLQGEGARARVLAAVAAEDAAAIPEALKAARGIQAERSREEVLATLAPHDPSGVREAARGIQDEWRRARVLAALAPYDPSGVHEAALGLQDEGARAKVLAAVAAEDAAAIPEALEAARGIRDERERAGVLAALARYDPSGVHEAALGILDEGERARVLAVVAAEDAAAIPEALEAARGIQDEWRRARVLAALAPYDPSGVHEAELGLQDEGERARVLAALAAEDAAAIPEALEAARGIQDERRREEVLATLAPHDPSGVREAALGIRNEWRRARVLAALAPFDPSGVHEAALGLQDEGARAEVLAAVAAVAAAAIPEALEAARGIRNEWERARVLAALARYDPSGVHEAALGLQGEGARARVLAAVAAEDAAAIPEALEAARGIQDERRQEEVLATLAPHDPSGVREAALGIRNNWRRARVLAALAPYDPSGVHEAALGLQDEGARAEVLAALAAEDAAAMPEAMEAARGIRDERERAGVLAALASSPFKPGNRIDLLRRCAGLTRPWFLKVLAALVSNPHDDRTTQAHGMILDAVRDTARWWP